MPNSSQPSPGDESDAVRVRHFDALARSYDTLDRRAGEAAAFFDVEHARDLIWEAVRQYLPQDQDAPILELGPGTGRWTPRTSVRWSLGAMNDDVYS